MCSHYIILVAFKGSCQNVKDELFCQQTGTKVIFVKGSGTQYSIVGQTTPLQTPKGGGGVEEQKNGRVPFEIHHPKCEDLEVAYGRWSLTGLFLVVSGRVGHKCVPVYVVPFLYQGHLTPKTLKWSVECV